MWSFINDRVSQQPLTNALLEQCVWWTTKHSAESMQALTLSLAPPH